MQEEWSFSQIAAGMDVCDSSGEKIGTVARVYRPARTAVAAGAMDAPEDVVEVKTGLLGLGTHYFVPASGIQNMGEDCVTLTRTKDQVEAWKTKPSYLQH